MTRKQIVRALSITLFACVCIVVGMACYSKMKSDETTDIEEKTAKITEEAVTDIEEKPAKITEKAVTDIEEKPAKITEKAVTNKVDASYEKWLASAMVIGISMTYSDFEIGDIYYMSDTPVSEKMESQGVIVSFTEAGEQKYLFSKPVAGENTEKGSRTLYSQDIEYASFEEIDGNPSEFENYKSMAQNELEEIIEQSLLVSVYEN